MTEIYYCKNEDDLKRVLMRAFLEYADKYNIEDAILEAKIARCDLIDDSEIDICLECEREDCLLYQHSKHKDIHKHIVLDRDIENSVCFPCIVCIADTYSNNEHIAICSVADAKEHTKYGYNESNW